MTGEQFIEECNKTPILAQYRKTHGPLTVHSLEDNGFIKESYEIKDILAFRDVLELFQPPQEPNDLGIVLNAGRAGKDLAHQRLIRTAKNQEIIEKCRLQLRMPHTNRGFRIEKERNIPSLVESFTNMEFDFSPEFERWFFDGRKASEIGFDEWETISARLVDEMDGEIRKVLAAWKLSKRYFIAIRELVLFNRIIPAAAGLSIGYLYDASDPRVSITFDVDIPKHEIISFINKDPYHFINQKKAKTALIKTRLPRKDQKETVQIIETYNRYKRDGKTDRDIFKIIRSKYRFTEDLSDSAIRKRVK